MESRIRGGEDREVEERHLAQSGKESGLMIGILVLMYSCSVG